MKSEHVNSFISAFMSVCKGFNIGQVKLGKPTLRQNPSITGDLAIIVGVVGDIKGQAVLSMDEEVAKKMASTMMMGAPVDELDEMARSAISELGNMVIGNASTNLSVLEIQNDITPPVVMFGREIEISHSLGTCLSIPFNTIAGEIILDISFNYN